MTTVLISAPFLLGRQKYFHHSNFLRHFKTSNNKKNRSQFFSSFHPAQVSKNSLFLPIPRTLSHKLSLYGSVNVTLKVLIFLLHRSLLKLKESRNNEAKKYFFVGSQDHSVCVFLFSVRSYFLFGPFRFII